MANGEITIDALMPPQMAARAEAIGIKKANIIEVEAADLAAIGELVYDRVRATPGVLDTLTCLAVE